MDLEVSFRNCGFAVSVQFYIWSLFKVIFLALFSSCSLDLSVCFDAKGSTSMHDRLREIYRVTHLTISPLRGEGSI
jgi:hypothetical protein